MFRNEHPAVSKHHLPITLNNSSDSRCRVVATVACGSAHEPENWPGLAHLLEHGLFLGSQSHHDSYNAGEIQAQLLQMGGMINASTQLFHTSYMLECPEEQISHCIELLSQLLFCPLFTAETMIGELDIIEAEYQARCGDGEQKIQAILQALSSPEHPYQRFCAGNKSTLAHNDPELLCILRRFYQHYYGPENITLWVEAPERLHNLIENSLPLSMLEHYQEAKAFHLEAILPCDRSVQFDAPAISDPTASWPDKDTLIAINTAPAGYEWCWRLPSLLLPAINQLCLPAGFHQRLRMLDPEQLILSIHYSVDDQLSKQDMQQQLSHLYQTLKFSRDSSTSPLQKSVQKALYHHYKLPIVEGDILSNSLLKQLKRPPRLSLLKHPDPADPAQTDYHNRPDGQLRKTAFFPTEYQIDYAFSHPLYVEQQPAVMPYRQLHMALMQNDDDTQQPGRAVPVDNNDPFNESALIWLPASALATEDDNSLINKQLCHAYIWQLQKQAYQSLRLEKKLGYIAHLGYQEVQQQPGILLLIQGESRFSGQQLLQALNLFLDEQFSLTQPLPDSDHFLWKSYCQHHNIDSDLSCLPKLNYQPELNVQLYSDGAINR